MGEIQAQDYSIKLKSIGVEDGLTSSTIVGYYQDSKGLMWMGTSLGLNRYDGNEVKTYTQEGGQLESNYVKYFAEDHTGKIWMSWEDPNYGNKNFTQVFDPGLEKAVSLKDHFSTWPEISDIEVIKMSSHLSTKELWFGTKDAIYLYSPEYPERPKLVMRGNFIYNSMEACTRGLWVSLKGKLMLIDREGKELQQISTDPDRTIYLYGVDKLDNVYHHVKIGEDDANGEASSVVYVANNPFANSSDAFWENMSIIGINPYLGQVWLRENDEDVVVYDHDLKEIHREHFEVSFYTHTKPFYFDRFGNAWTNQSGRVNIISLRQQKFTNYLSDVKVYGKLNYGARGLHVDGDQLYTSGLGRSYKIDLSTGDKVEFAPSPDFYPQPDDDLRWGKRLGLIGDNKGNLWYTDEGNRLARLNKNTKEESNFTYSSDQYAINEARENPRSMRMHWISFMDSKDRLWLGRKNGLAYLSNPDSTLKLFLNYGNFPELQYSEVIDLHENQEGIWIASQTGLYLMDKEYKVKKRFHRQTDQGDFIPHNSIAHIQEDANGIFWLASKGGGIIKLNTQTGDYRQYTERDGLSNNTVYASYFDQSGFLWVPSNKGIMQIDTTDFKVITYLKGDGLVQEEFNTLSHFQTDDGRLFFGHLNGVTAFDPKDFEKPQDQSAKLIVTSFQKQARSTGLYQPELSSFLKNQSIEIKPKEVGFNIGFSLLNYLDAASNLYSYKIEGLDQEWNYISEPFVRINALDYGNYNLLLRGQASQGLWSDEMVIPIAVITPFYLSIWFIILLILLLAIFAYASIKYRERSLLSRQTFLEGEIDKRTVTIRQQAEELKELDQLKSKFFANVSHELRTPLSLIVGPVKNLITRPGIDEQVKKDLLRVKKNSEQMEKLVTEILDLTKLENKKLIPRYKSVLPKSFFSRLHNNFESRARAKSITFDFQFRGDPSGFALDVDMCERILNNLLSNAFKFTSEGGRIDFHVEINEERLKSSVSDNGLGISEKDLPHVFERFFQTKDSQRSASGGTGIGLALSKELAQAMEGNLIVESHLGQGSRFELTLPNTEAPPAAVHEETETVVPQNGIALTAPANNGQRKILVVEDHPDMRAFIMENLQQQFTCFEAENGKEALHLLDEEQLKPDVIISDMMMPEMDGMELLANIRDKDTYKAIPLIMLTARTADDDKLEAFRLGADDYLVKPFSVNELVARIRNQFKNLESKRVANLVSEVEYTHEQQPEEAAEACCWKEATYP